jgi:hypothetical protein
MHDIRILEAYPQIDILQAINALGSGRSVCRFDCDVRGPLGVAWFSQTDETQGLLELRLAARHLATCGRPQLLDFVWMKTSLGHERIYVQCPICRKPFIKLAWKGDWRCRSCHKLHYRRQMITRPFLDYERKLELDRMLRGGRPKGMRQRRYVELLAEKRALSRTVPKGIPSMLSREQRYLVRSAWFATDANQVDLELDWFTVLERHIQQESLNR